MEDVEFSSSAALLHPHIRSHADSRAFVLHRSVKVRNSSVVVVLLNRRAVCCVAVPAPPSLVTKVLNGSVIQATWEPSSKMGQHQGFRLYYRRAHTPHFTGPFTFPRNVSQHTITELGETRRFLRHPHACVTTPSRRSRLSLKGIRSVSASRIRDQTGGCCPGGNFVSRLKIVQHSYIYFIFIFFFSSAM